jgi:hypothetical protein
VPHGAKGVPRYFQIGVPRNRGVRSTPVAPLAHSDSDTPPKNKPFPHARVCSKYTTTNGTREAQSVCSSLKRNALQRHSGLRDHRHQAR